MYFFGKTLTNNEKNNHAIQQFRQEYSCNKHIQKVNPKEQNMFVSGRFHSTLVDKHEQHSVFTNEEHDIFKYKCIKLKQNLHSAYEKSIIERTMQYIKDRTEYVFDD